jgi:hypothetical protein
MVQIQIFVTRKNAVIRCGSWVPIPADHKGVILELESSYDEAEDMCSIYYSLLCKLLHLVRVSQITEE